MRLLIVTQKADSSDPILGFFHRWLELFASHVESLTVIAQQAGEWKFPANVHVYSLGKESGRAKWLQILRFWFLLWRLRNQYDCVLVHMTPVWVILGGPLLMLLRKRLYLWYEIHRGSLRLSLALLFVRKVFSATAQGLPQPHGKQVVTGHGIDTEAFFLPLSPGPSPALLRSSGASEGQGGGGEHREPGLIVSVGRITRSKRYDVILRAFAGLPKSCRLFIAGGMVTRADEEEWERLQFLLKELSLTGRVTVCWVDPVDMPSLLQRADISLHACVGGLDKTVLEAMASGCPVISSSEAAQEILPESCRAIPETIAQVARKILALSPSERATFSEDLRRRVVEGHSLPKLIERLVGEMSGISYFV